MLSIKSCDQHTDDAGNRQPTDQGAQRCFRHLMKFLLLLYSKNHTNQRCAFNKKRVAELNAWLLFFCGNLLPLNLECNRQRLICANLETLRAEINLYALGILAHQDILVINLHQAHFK